MMTIPPAAASAEVIRRLPHNLIYRVDGDSNQADTTFENSSGDTSQETGAALPWTETFTVEEGSFAYVSAQRGGAPGRAGDSAIVR
jgi:hypothetical protein